MKRLHVMLQVADLEESLKFYAQLFGVPPSVRKSDYAKWMLSDPRVNFSIGLTTGAAGLGHLGIQAETREELEMLRARIGLTGGAIEHEGETTCCYARSDKSWVTDAQGVSWEMFYTHGSSDTYDAVAPGDAGDLHASRCCAPGCCDAG